MEKSIMKIFESVGYETIDFDQTYIDKIDKILNHGFLRIEVCEKGKVWYSKRDRYYYNVKLQLYKNKNCEPKWLPDETRYVNVKSEKNVMKFLELVLSDFCFKFLPNEFPKTDLSESDSEWLRESKNKKKRNSIQMRKDSSNDSDDVSEKTIMNDLMKGEGYKHGFE